MKGLHIRGLACPYNVENCYGETMRPGAFDHWLESLGGVKGIDGYIEVDCADLEMGFMHEAGVGTWSKLWTTGEGLWCEGYVENPLAAATVAVGATPELSIDWSKGDFPFTKASDGEEVPSVMAKGRAQSFVQQCVNVPPQTKVVEHLVEHRDVECDEISLVDRGAFDGTHNEVVNANA